MGEYLRKQLKARLRTEHITTAENLYLDSQYKALERLTNNEHIKAYPRTKETSASSLTVEQCHLVISESSLKFFKEQSEGLFSRFKKRLSVQPENGASK